MDWLTVEDSGTASEFARRLPISRQAVARHLAELEEAGVVTSAREGRETRFRLRPAALIETSEWLRLRADAWDQAFGRLKESVEDSR